MCHSDDATCTNSTLRSKHCRHANWMHSASKQGNMLSKVQRSSWGVQGDQAAWLLLAMKRMQCISTSETVSTSETSPDESPSADCSASGVSAGHHVRPNQMGQPCSQQVSSKQSDLQLQKLPEPGKTVDTTSVLELTV